MDESDRTQIWSSGGGVQSSAIGALICGGLLPPPDLAMIVDTERELSTTWDYMDNIMRPALAKVGCDLVRVKKSDFATVDLYSGEKGDDILIPAFTTESGDGVGKLPTYCSNEWKQRVMRRWANSKGVKQADIWIGFSIDEMKRVTIPTGKWQHRYPLIEQRMSRGDCIALVERMGWPTPPRSACYMCPNKPMNEWRWQSINAPEDHQKAIDFEIEIQTVDPDLWLTQTGKPLSELDLTEEDDFFNGQCAGNCFT